jgi:hypothetical protein
MIRPRYLPPNSCFDDPASRMDQSEVVETVSYALAGEALHFVFDWIIQGEVEQRSLRFHLVALTLWPQLLPCKRPTASWCARIHGVSRQWATRLKKDFSRAMREKSRRSSVTRNRQISPSRLS